MSGQEENAPQVSLLRQLPPPLRSSRAAGWAKVRTVALAQMSRLALHKGIARSRAHQCSIGPAQARSELSLKRKEGSTRAAEGSSVPTRSDWPETTQNLHIT
jgi:hypothetical protein